MPLPHYHRAVLCVWFGACYAARSFRADWCTFGVCVQKWDCCAQKWGFCVPKMGCFCVQKWGFSGLHRDGTICPHAHPLRHAGEPDEQCPSPTAQSVAPAPWVRTRALRNKRSTERTRVTSRAGWFTGRNSRSFCTRCMLRMLVRSRPPVSTACRRFSLGNQRQPPLTTATVFTVTTANHHPRARLLPSPHTSPHIPAHVSSHPRARLLPSALLPPRPLCLPTATAARGPRSTLQ